MFINLIDCYNLRECISEMLLKVRMQTKKSRLRSRTVQVLQTAAVHRQKVQVVARHLMTVVMTKRNHHLNQSEFM